MKHTHFILFYLIFELSALFQLYKRDIYICSVVEGNTVMEIVIIVCNEYFIQQKND